MRRNFFIIAAFALILALPALDGIFHFSPVKDLFEKRLPVEKPSLPQNFSQALEYPKNFEKFFDDNYGFRKTFVSLNSKIMDKVFDESPDARAVVGKDGWFYFDNHNSLLDAVGKATLSDELVERGVEVFAKNWQEMRAKNIDYLLVIAADKTTIYPEFLPTYLQAAPPHRIDKFLDALKKKYPDFPVIDLRPILLAAKKNEILYHQTDTHWNRRGAHYAYVEIAKKLGIKPNLRSKFEDKEDGFFRGDISDIMGVETQNVDYDLLEKFPIKIVNLETTPEEKSRFHKPMFFQNSDKNLPVIFVYKDSYFGNLLKFISTHFSRSYYVNEFPCNLTYQRFANYKPNVVIQEFWEGRIEVVLNSCKN
jgi:hypothetical protein